MPVRVRRVAARLLERERDAEVGDERMPALQQHVLRLHVAVHDAVAVRVLERVRHLARELQGDVHGQAPLAREPRAQRLALDEGHDVPQQPARAPRVEQREDVRVLQRRGDADLLEEPLGADGGGELLAQHLDRDAAVVPQVAREVHGGHAAARRARARSRSGPRALSRVARRAAAGAPGRRAPRRPAARGSRRRRGRARRAATRPRAAAPRRSPHASRDERVALRRLAGERGLEDRVDRAPALGRHRRVGGVGSLLELAAEPHARDGPLATDGRRRDAERLRGLGDAEPGEVAQLHQPGLLRIEHGEARERVVQRDHVDASSDAPSADGAPRSADDAIRTAERDLHRAAAALERAARARVVQQHAPHHLRGDGEELRAALPARVVLVAEPQPRLVHERGGLEGVSLALAAQRELRLPAKLRVHEPHERLARLSVAGAPRAQQLGHRVPGVPLGAGGAAQGRRQVRAG